MERGRVKVKRTSKIDGIELFYSDAGDHGRDVLLIHGHPFDTVAKQGRSVTGRAAGRDPSSAN